MSAFAMLNDTRQDSNHTVNYTAKIYRQAEIPVFIGAIFNHAARTDAGIIYQYVDFTEYFLRFVSCFHIRFTVGYVKLNRMNRIISRRKIRHRFIDGILAGIDDDDFHLVGSEYLSNTEADTAGTAGDKGNLSFYIFHYFRLLFTFSLSEYRTSRRCNLTGPAF